MESGLLTELKMALVNNEIAIKLSKNESECIIERMRDVSLSLKKSISLIEGK